MSRTVPLRHGGRDVEATLALTGAAAALERDGRRLEAVVTRDGPWLELEAGGRALRAATARDARGIWVSLEGRVYLFEVAQARGVAEAPEATGEVRAPMTGRVASVEARAGSRVREGDLLLTIEAMKMEFKVLAPAAGTVAIDCAAGDRVELGQMLARIEEANGAET
ncbi:MAG: acetyl-CoA carboxylase biotin carboxyl carrier protein subunit [Bacteroidota bacterium]